MRKKIFLLLFTTAFVTAGAQVNVWSDISAASLTERRQADAMPSGFRAMTINQGMLNTFLGSVPAEERVSVRISQSVISLPMPDGRMENYRIVEAPIMEKPLADKYPEIKTFMGQGIDDPAATVRFHLTPNGFQAMIIKPDGYIIIEPHAKGNLTQYISYYVNDLPAPVNRKFCEVKAGLQNTGRVNAMQKVSGANLRTYRLAVAATGEYTAQNGGTVASALAGIVAVINLVNVIYESEVAIRFVIIADNDDIIYTNAGTDPYGDVADPCNMRGTNQANIDAEVGSGSYDVGHVVSGTNIGGCASFAVPCGGSKAWGASGVTDGGTFDIGLVAHEMGHQFGAGHTFNSNISFCLGGQYSASTAYEPGSGTTIMSYAGNCHVIQASRDLFFHTISYEQIIDFSTTGGGNACPVTTATGNAPPIVNAGGGGYVIPIGTPFKLTGSGSDPDGDPLTFSWEQFDLGPTGHPNTPSGNAPIFRFFPPVNNPSRTFPKLSNILNNTQTIGELLPSYTRELNFRLTARDNRAGGGGVEYASMTMSADDGAGPFEITSPNTSVSWCPGAHTITWNVANTDVAPVNTTNVNILLSTDGGNTFPITLASNTANDGSESVNMPCIRSTQARIKIEAVGNVFFDISNANFSTGDNTDPTFTEPADITLYKDANCLYDASTAVTGDVTNEDDNCDNTIDATYADAIAAGSCVGETIITRTWTLTDDCLNSTSRIQIITIMDNTAPTFTAPADITIYKDANCNHDASVAATGDVTDEADNCDPALDATFTDVSVPGSCMGEEIITRTWTLTDDCLNSISHNQVITVRDTTRPSFTNVFPSPANLWPPNHTMRLVTINYTVADNCSDAAHITSVLSVASNEPVNGPADGNTAPDWIVVDDHHVWLRAERAGNRNARVYTITITSTDDCGNVGTTTTTVNVAHDQGNRMENITLVPFGLDVTATPNPSRGTFTITVNSELDDKITLQVFDMYGRRIDDQAIPLGTTRIGSSYMPGVYTIKVSQGLRSKEIKVVKL